MPSPELNTSPATRAFGQFSKWTLCLVCIYTLWGKGRCVQSRRGKSASTRSWDGGKNLSSQGRRRREGGEEQIGVSENPGSVQH